MQNEMRGYTVHALKPRGKFYFVGLTENSSFSVIRGKKCVRRERDFQSILDYNLTLKMARREPWQTGPSRHSSPSSMGKGPSKRDLKRERKRGEKKSCHECDEGKLHSCSHSAADTVRGGGGAAKTLFSHSILHDGGTAGEWGVDPRSRRVKKYQAAAKCQGRRRMAWHFFYPSLLRRLYQGHEISNCTLYVHMTVRRR